MRDTALGFSISIALSVGVVILGILLTESTDARWSSAIESLMSANVDVYLENRETVITIFHVFPWHCSEDYARLKKRLVASTPFKRSSMCFIVVMAGLGMRILIDRCRLWSSTNRKTRRYGK